MLQQFFQMLFPAPPSDAPLVGKYYRRTGDCNQCGKCCTNIMLSHGRLPIDSEELFKKLQGEYPEYRHFKVIDRSEDGLLFRCEHLQPDNTCAIYNKRPQLCRQYPTEQAVMNGAALSEECSYQFEALHTFREVLAGTADKKTLKAGKLLR